MRAWILIVLAGCGGSTLTCGVGTAEDDGVCVVPEGEPPTAADLIDQLPPCTTTEGNGRLDLERGCVDGGCAGMSYGELVAAWGDPVCESYGDYGFCDFPNYVMLNLVFADDAQDGEPDEDTVPYSLQLYGSDATTDSGAGLRVGLACFVEALGEPETADLRNVPRDGWQFANMSWGSRIYVDDQWGGGKEGASPDGLVDGISLYAPYDDGAL